MLNNMKKGKQMKICVTGANGYIGSHVVDWLLKNTTNDVIAVDFLNTKINVNAKFVNIDILGMCDDVNLYEKLERPDVIIHLAWRDGFNHNSDAHLLHLRSHYTFLKNMIDSGCKNINVMGTMHEIGFYTGEINENTPCNPMSLYGIAKNSLRQALLAYASDKDVFVKWLRAFYIIGDDKHNNSVFSKILEMAQQGQKTFPFVSGTNQYDFISIDELSAYIAQTSIQTSVLGIVNVCSGTPVPLKDKVQEFIKEHKLQIKPEFGAFPSRKYDSPLIYGNTENLRKILGKSK